MKDFMKYTFASLLGVVLASVVLVILGIVTMVGMMVGIWIFQMIRHLLAPSIRAASTVSSSTELKAPM